MIAILNINSKNTENVEYIELFKGKFRTNKVL
jgi:hypothetical protein